MLDTNALSELRKPKPDAGFVTWVGSVPERALYTTSVTLGELRLGIELAAVGVRRDDLERWLVVEVAGRFSGRVFGFDAEAADRWGRLEASARRGGGKIPLADGMVAAIALVHDLPVVTRNSADFVRTGVALVNPWAG